MYNRRQSALGLVYLRLLGGSTVMFCYCLLEGDTVVPSGLYARLCRAILVVHFIPRKFKVIHRVSTIWQWIVLPRCLISESGSLVFGAQSSFSFVLVFKLIVFQFSLIYSALNQISQKQTFGICEPLFWEVFCYCRNTEIAFQFYNPLDTIEIVLFFSDNLFAWY